MLTALLAPVWTKVPTLVCSAFAAAALTVVVAGSVAAPEAGSIRRGSCRPCSGRVRRWLQAPVPTSSRFVLGVSTAGRDRRSVLQPLPLALAAHRLRSGARPGRELDRSVAAFVSFAPAFVSFRLLENPIRRMQFGGWRAVRLAAVCAAIPAAAAAVAMPISLVTPASYSNGLHQDQALHCDGPTPLGDPARAHCTVRAPNARGTIVLIGDSNAGQFTEPVLNAARALHLDVDVVTYSACAFVPLQIQERGCANRNAASMKAMARVRPKLVVIAARSDVMVEDDRVSIGAQGGALTSSPSLKAHLYQRALHEELSDLDRLGIRVARRSSRSAPASRPGGLCGRHARPRPLLRDALACSDRRRAPARRAGGVTRSTGDPTGIGHEPRRRDLRTELVLGTAWRGSDVSEPGPPECPRAR